MEGEAIKQISEVIRRLKCALHLGLVRMVSPRELGSTGGCVMVEGKKIIDFRGVYRCDLCGDAWTTDYTNFFYYPGVDFSSFISSEVFCVFGGGFLVCWRCHYCLLKDREGEILEKLAKSFDGLFCHCQLDGKAISYNPLVCGKVREGVWWCATAKVLYKNDTDKCLCYG